MDASKLFSDWALAYSGVDGGDIGSPSSPAIWLCGIEWGGVHSADKMCQHITQDADTVGKPHPGYDKSSDNLAYSYNR